MEHIIRPAPPLRKNARILQNLGSFNYKILLIPNPRYNSDDLNFDNTLYTLSDMIEIKKLNLETSINKISSFTDSTIDISNLQTINIIQDINKTVSWTTISKNNLLCYWMISQTKPNFELIISCTRENCGVINISSESKTIITEIIDLKEGSNLYYLCYNDIPYAQTSSDIINLGNVKLYQDISPEEPKNSTDTDTNNTSSSNPDTIEIEQKKEILNILIQNFNKSSIDEIKNSDNKTYVINKLENIQSQLIDFISNYTIKIEKDSDEIQIFKIIDEAFSVTGKIISITSDNTTDINEENSRQDTIIEEIKYNT